MFILLIKLRKYAHDIIAKFVYIFIYLFINVNASDVQGQWLQQRRFQCSLEIVQVCVRYWWRVCSGQNYELGALSLFYAIEKNG
jgi:hypothetical protein